MPAPKPTKPEVFDPSRGGVHLRTWLSSLDNYFHALGTPREDFDTCKNYAISLLKGPALEWLRQVVLHKQRYQQ